MNQSPNVHRVAPDATVADALLRLREESFDAVVATHHAGFDALVFARALRGAGDETPVAILGATEQEARAAGADIGLADGESRDLAARLEAAIAARVAMRDSRRLLVAQQQRLGGERAEVERVAAQQQRQLAALREVAGPDVRRYPAAEPSPHDRAARAA